MFFHGQFPGDKVIEEDSSTFYASFIKAINDVKRVLKDTGKINGLTLSEEDKITTEINIDNFLLYLDVLNAKYELVHPKITIK